MMSKRTQKESCEERVTAKSRPMMNLVARCSERAPTALSSTASESPVKTIHESQIPLSPQAEKYDRTGRPVVCAHSSRYSEWNVDKTWSSQEWKSDELMDDRTERPIVCSQRASQTRFSRECKNVILEDDANHDRTVRPVVCSQNSSQTRFSRDSTNFNVEEEANHDRTGKPVVCRDANHEQSMVNEVDIDFRISGLPHSVVKQAENSRVRELVKKIENHPHRQALQHDLQQNNAYNHVVKSPRR